MMDALYGVGKKVLAVAGALVVAELVCIGGNALMSDATTVAGKLKNVVAKPTVPEPKKFGLFRKVK